MKTQSCFEGVDLVLSLLDPVLYTRIFLRSDEGVKGRPGFQLAGLRGGKQTLTSRGAFTDVRSMVEG